MAAIKKNEIKKNDFVEIDYTGRTKSDNAVFDTTLKEVSEAEDVGHEGHEYRPSIICVGENQVIPGIDEALIGREEGSEFIIDIPPEKGFGKKSAKLLRMIPQRVFTKQEIQVQPGIQVQVDGQFGIIRSASGGRVIVDFNNPLAGKDLSYEIKIRRVVTEAKEKVSSILHPIFGDLEVSIHEGDATVTVPTEVPQEMTIPFTEKIKALVPEIKGMIFKIKATTVQK